MRGAGASCLPAVSPGADAAGRGFTLAACSLGRGHFRTHAQPRGCRSRVGGRGRAGRSAGGSPASRSPQIPESPRLRRALQALPTNRLSEEVCGFPFSSSSPSFPPVRTKADSPRTRSLEEEGPAQPPRMAIRAVRAGQQPGEPQKGREENNRPVLSPPPAAGRDAARVPLWREPGKQAAGPSREEQGGTAAAITPPGARRCPLLGSQESRAEERWVCIFTPLI